METVTSTERERPVVNETVDCVRAVHVGVMAGVKPAPLVQLSARRSHLHYSANHGTIAVRVREPDGHICVVPVHCVRQLPWGGGFFGLNCGLRVRIRIGDDPGCCSPQALHPIYSASAVSTPTAYTVDLIRAVRPASCCGGRACCSACWSDCALLLPWIYNLTVLGACILYVLYAVLLVLEAEAILPEDGFAAAAAQAYGISIALHFLVKDPLIALIIAALPTRAHTNHKMMNAVAEAFHRSPVDMFVLNG